MTRAKKGREPKFVQALRAEVRNLQIENERLRRESEGYDAHRRNREALAHARKQIEVLDAPDSYTRTMNERAVDAITELIGR